MARSDSGFACHNHRDRVSFEIHHVWPRQYGGPDTPDNLVQLCPSGHSDVHDLLRALLNGRRVDLRHYGPGIRRLARRGFAEIIADAEVRLRG